MSASIHEANSESKARASPRGGGRRKPATVRRGTPTTYKARFPRRRWHHTLKAGELEDGVNVVPAP
jgi:hypothetical protein